MARWFTAEDWAFMDSTGTPPPQHEPEPGKDTTKSDALSSRMVWTTLAVLMVAFLIAATWTKVKVATAPTSSPTPSAAVRPVVGMPAPVLPNPKLTSALKVTRVIDGDTFEVSDGSKVRVLGIDACEMSTPAGRDAQDSAELWLTDKMVDLTMEPGVDRDRYGRLLRYVDIQVGGGTYWQDFGAMMVAHKHTGVYEGKNDASAQYVAELRAADMNGRDCSGPGGFARAPEDTAYVPTPSDGDDDEESRFCRRRWWC